MSRNDQGVSLKALVWLVTGLVAGLWLLHGLLLLSGVDASILGVRPRVASGLLGVLTAPLIHASWLHLFSNTLPLLVLGTAMFHGFPGAARRALPLIWIGSGLLVWLLAREGVHAGASGIAFGMMFFVFTAGLLRRDRASVALVLLVFFLHGSMVWGVLPQAPGVSWESHLAGAVVGVVSGVWFRRRDPLPTPAVFDNSDLPDEPFSGEEASSDSGEDDTGRL
ncbi:rhomboid family intramembrane serine protease [Natronospira bacteriovora]|uniref:Rhomboid family intramembrane serine protease n=1 Tax=Natronospira bacteriovora TaxID=3069753 RepID=A0ABU0W5L9_9GAMM|nr:rhomboid family intramembrane serine protease [Natronospira sp. AB-CW4]MDQ2069218.1 rhomboid family intramembrane serine protease [Natronospira sp. AB-CW4]